jgi:hypothetical protein
VAVVIDDRLLLDVLAGLAPARVAAELGEGGVFTTSSWYYRLGRAASSGSGLGAMSGPITSFDVDVRRRVVNALQDLPDDIGLLHPRIVRASDVCTSRTATTQRSERRCTWVAALVGGDILVTTDAPILKAGAAELGVHYEIVA